jgi:autotransporter-associated beta strand protein
MGNSVQATSVSLATAGDFSVLAASTITDAGTSHIIGNLGLSPGTSVTGLAGSVTGTIHIADATAVQAQLDAASAFSYLSGLEVTQDLSGTDLGGLVLTPGVYRFSAASQLSGTLILNGMGQSHPLFVFQIGSTLTTASGASIEVINGASASDTYFQVGSSATLGTGTNFAGNLLAAASATITTGSNVDGRILAAVAVTLDSNHISLASTTGTTWGLTKTGSYTLDLLTANGYSGTTTLKQGVLQLGVASVGAVGAITASALGSDALVLQGGTLSSDGTTARSILNAVIFGGNPSFGDVANNGKLTFVAEMDLGGATRIATLNSAVEISGVLCNGGLTKAGAGTLTLSGSNTYAGGTTLSAGSVAIGSAAAVGTGTITFNGGVLDISSTLTLGNTIVANDASHGVSVDSGQTLTLSGPISGSYGLHKAGSGFLVMAGSSNTAPTVISAGTATGTTANVGTSLTVTSDATFNFTQSTAGTYGGEINGAGKVAVSGRLTLTGTNPSFSGDIEIGHTATLAVATRDSLGGSAITLDGSVDGASVLQFTSSSSNNANGGNTYANNITVSANQGVLHNSGTGTVTLGGSIGKNGSVLVLWGGAFDITGVITGSSSNSDLVVDAATVSLSSANSYNGPTWIRNAGTLNANVAGALPTFPRSDVIMDASGTGSSKLALGASQQIASLTGTSTATVELGTNTLTMGTSSGTTTFDGVITGSGGALVKGGASIQILSGTSTYTGTTTVAAGTLVVNGDQHAANGAVLVSGILAGSGTVGGATTINSGGTHAPGAVGAVGTQNFSGALTYAAGSIFEWDLNASGANMVGMAYDMVGADGAITVDTTTATFKIVFGDTVSMSDAFWSMPYVTHTWAMSSIFGKAFVNNNGFTTVQTSYDVSQYGHFTISGTSLIYSGVPEPTSALVGLLLGAGLLRRCRCAPIYLSRCARSDAGAVHQVLAVRMAL